MPGIKMVDQDFARALVQPLAGLVQDLRSLTLRRLEYGKGDLGEEVRCRNDGHNRVLVRLCRGGCCDLLIQVLKSCQVGANVDVRTELSMRRMSSVSHSLDTG